MKIEMADKLKYTIRLIYVAELYGKFLAFLTDLANLLGLPESFCKTSTVVQRFSRAQYASVLQGFALLQLPHCCFGFSPKRVPLFRLPRLLWQKPCFPDVIGMNFDLSFIFHLWFYHQPSIWDASYMPSSFKTAPVEKEPLAMLESLQKVKSRLFSAPHSRFIPFGHSSCVVVALVHNSDE